MCSFNYSGGMKVQLIIYVSAGPNTKYQWMKRNVLVSGASKKPERIVFVLLQDSPAQFFKLVTSLMSLVCQNEILLMAYFHAFWAIHIILHDNLCCCSILTSLSNSLSDFVLTASYFSSASSSKKGTYVLL